jgi:hypothetical protein
MISVATAIENASETIDLIGRDEKEVAFPATEVQKANERI